MISNINVFVGLISCSVIAVSQVSLTQMKIKKSLEVWS